MEDISLLIENLYAIPTHKTTKKLLRGLVSAAILSQYLVQRRQRKLFSHLIRI